MRRIAAALILALAIPAGAAVAQPAAQQAKAPIPAEAQAAYEKGTQLLSKKKWKAAAKALQAAVDQAEHFTDAHVNLSIALRRLGKDQVAQAMLHAQKACELDFQHAHARYQRGVAYALLGNEKRARNEHVWLVKRALPLGPELAAVIESKKEDPARPLLGAMGLSGHLITGGPPPVPGVTPEAP